MVGWVLAFTVSLFVSGVTIRLSRTRSPGVSDGLHLHMLVFRRLVRFHAPRWLVMRSRRGGPLSRFKDGL